MKSKTFKKNPTLIIIQSEFNKALVEELYQSALKEFDKPLDIKNLYVQNLYVPGAGEIPQVIKWALDTEHKALGVLALGVIIRGETSHFDFLKDFLQTALWDLQKNHSVPIVSSVLMLENREQFKKRVVRAGEATQALLKMIELKERLTDNLISGSKLRKEV